MKFGTRAWTKNCSAYFSTVRVLLWLDIKFINVTYSSAKPYKDRSEIKYTKLNAHILSNISDQKDYFKKLSDFSYIEKLNL